MNQIISARTKVNVIIGHPISHSLTPALHNAAYLQLQIADKYVMIAAKVEVAHLGNALLGVRALNINGLSVTTPHKQSILSYLDSVDDDVKLIGAVNTVVNRDGKLVGSNTDWIGIRDALAERRPLTDASVLVLGAGGAARAAVYGLKKSNAQVTIANRTLVKAAEIAREFQVDVIDFDSLTGNLPFDIVVNCTTVGMGTNTESPLEDASFRPGQIVFETIYLPRETKLVRQANSCNAEVIFGTDMFFHQAVAQIEHHVGEIPDRGALRRAFGSILGEH